MNGLFSSLLGYAAPYIQDIIATAVVAGLGWLFTLLQSKLKINIDAGRRDAITASAKRVAGELFTEIVAGHVNLGDLFAKAVDGTVLANTNHPVVVAKIAKVQAAAKDSLKHFKAANDAPLIASKIFGELGPMLAASGFTGPAGVISGLLSAPIVR